VLSQAAADSTGPP